MEYKKYLYDYCEEKLQRAPNGGYICPCCDNGSGSSGTGMLLNPKQNYETWKCFKCGEGGDIYKLVEIVESLDFSKAKKYVEDSFKGKEHQDVPKQRIGSSRNSYRFNSMEKFYDKAHGSLNILFYLNKDNYFKQRGISEETCNRFNLGLVNDYKGRSAAIIPVNDNYFIARSIDEPWHLATGDMKVLNPTGVKTDFFNKQCLKQDNPVFVVEGWADALSAIECGYEALSINSCAYKNKLIEEVIKAKPSSIIIALDGDKAGREANDYICKKLNETGIYAVNFEYPKEYKDMNEWLCKDSLSLKQALKRSVNMAKFMPVLQDYKGDYQGSDIIKFDTFEYKSNKYHLEYDINDEYLNLYDKNNLLKSFEMTTDDFMNNINNLKEKAINSIKNNDKDNLYL